MRASELHKCIVWTLFLPAGSLAQNLVQTPVLVTNKVSTTPNLVPMPPMPYLNAVAHGLFTGTYTAVVPKGQQGDFFTTARFDLNANLGGVYHGLQTPFPAITTNTVMRSAGQGIGIFSYVKGLGKGNALAMNAVVDYYGGGEVDGNDSVPEASPTGEFEADQGNRIFRASLAADLIPPASTLTYNMPVNAEYIGARYLLNLNRTYTQGTVTDITGQIVTFAGVDWNSVKASGSSPVGQYIKVGSSQEFYLPDAAGNCSGDDVRIGPGTQADPVYCSGHFYRIDQIVSTTLLKISGTIYYDYVGLAATMPTAGLPQPYVMIQGAEIVAYATGQLTLDSNTYTWKAGDRLISPPNHIVGVNGINLIVRKTYKTQRGTVQSSMAKLVSLGPYRMDYGLWFLGPEGGGGFDTLIKADGQPFLRRGLDLSAVDTAENAIAIRRTGPSGMATIQAIQASGAPPVWSVTLSNAAGITTGTQLLFLNAGPGSAVAEAVSVASVAGNIAKLRGQPQHAQVNGTVRWYGNNIFRLGEYGQIYNDGSAGVTIVTDDPARTSSLKVLGTLPAAGAFANADAGDLQVVGTETAMDKFVKITFANGAISGQGAAIGAKFTNLGYIYIWALRTRIPG